MKRPPVFATLVVLVAVVTMVGLGFWQLGRAEEKEAALARITSNVRLSAAPVTRDLDLDANLLRPATVRCDSASATRLAGAGQPLYCHRRRSR